MTIAKKVEELEKKGYFELQQKLLEIAQGEREIAQWNDIVNEQVKILEASLREVEEEAKKEIPDDIEPLYMPGGDPRAIRKNPMSGITPKMIGD